MNIFRQSIHFVRTFELTIEWYEENRFKLLRIVGVILTLLIVIIISPRTIIGDNLIPRMIVAGVIAVYGGILMLANPSLAIIAIIPMALVVPFSIGTGTGTEINAAIIIESVAIALWILDLMVLRKPFRINSMPVKPALALAGSAILSLIVGQIPWFFTNHASIFAQLGGTMLYLLAVGAYLVMSHRISERGLNWMVWVFLGLGGIYMILRFLFSYVGYVVMPALNRFQDGAFGSFFWVWFLCLLIGQGLFNKKLPGLIRGIFLLLAGLTFYVAFFLARGWTSGWLPALLGVLVVLWLGFPRMRYLILLSVILIVGSRWQAIYNNIASVIMVGDNAYSMITRVAAMKILFQIFEVNPIFGFGPANYYFYTPLFPILNYSVSFNSHNNYVDLLVQTGIFGFASFAFFIVQLVRLGLRLLGRVNEGFMKAYLLSALGGVIGGAAAGLLGDWMIPFVYNIGFYGFRASVMGWLFMGGIAAIERILEERECQPGHEIK